MLKPDFSKCPVCGSEKVIGIGDRCCFSPEPYDSRIMICTECHHKFGFDTRNIPEYFGMPEVMWVIGGKKHYAIAHTERTMCGIKLNGRNASWLQPEPVDCKRCLKLVKE